MDRPHQPKKKSGKQAYVKYAGLAMQIVGSLLLAVYVGNWLDGRFEMKHPVFLLVLSTLVIIGLMAKLIRDISKK